MHAYLVFSTLKSYVTLVHLYLIIRHRMTVVSIRNIKKGITQQTIADNDNALNPVTHFNLKETINCNDVFKHQDINWNTYTMQERANNVDRSCLGTPWQNGPYKNKQTEQQKTRKTTRMGMSNNPFVCVVSTEVVSTEIHYLPKGYSNLAACLNFLLLLCRSWRFGFCIHVRNKNAKTTSMFINIQM